MNLILKYISMAVMVMLIMTACGKKQYEPVEPGIYEMEYQSSGATLYYSISIPEEYTGKTEVPLIVALHYGGYAGPYYGKMILRDMVEVAFHKLGAIIVAPDVPASDWTHPISERYVLELMDLIEETYNVDSSRVLVTGYSMGGIGTWHFASRVPDRFSAAIVMAGAPPADALETDWEVPLYVIQGREDELFPVDESMLVVSKLQSRGENVKLRILDDVTHYDTYRFVNPLKDTIPWVLDTWK